MNAVVGNLTHRATIADDKLMVCALRLSRRCKRATHQSRSHVLPLGLKLVFRFAQNISERTVYESFDFVRCWLSQGEFAASLPRSILTRSASSFSDYVTSPGNVIEERG